MYSLHLRTASSNAAGAKFERYGPARLAGRNDVRQLQVGHALLQAFHEPIDPLAGGAIAGGRVFGIDVGVGHGRDGLR